MTMKSNIFKLFAFVSMLSLSSCFEDPGTEIVWGDKALLELDRAGQPNPTVVRTFALADGAAQTLNVQVNLMGKPQANDVTVNFTIAPGTTSATAAVEGTHYNKVTSGTSIVIPAGENIANIEFQVLPGNMAVYSSSNAAATTYSFIVTITGGDLPLSKYVTATFNLRRSS